MRDDGYAGDAEGFNLQSLGQMLQTAAPAAMQGAAAGSAFGPWGALVSGLGAGALSMAAQAQGPSGAPQRPAVQAAPPRPAVQTAPPPTQTAPPPTPAPAPAASASAPGTTPVAAPAPSAATPASAPAPAFASSAAQPPAGDGSAGTLNQVMSLLGNPQIQQILSSLASGQRPSTANLLGGAGAALNTFAPPAGATAEAEDAEAANGGGAVGWLIATGVARQQA